MKEPLHLLLRGSTPLLINVPHAGAYLPPELSVALTPAAQSMPDTDWHVPFLYKFALMRGASLMAATHSRYVVDLNRDPDNVELYPGVDNSELCPLKTFANEAIYLEGQAPDAEAVAKRVAEYWLPYHYELDAQLATIHARHGYAILLDAHSIRTKLPRFFEGRLPDLNLGTVDGASCDAELEALANAAVKSGAPEFTSVINGRFKGGYITRFYGQPDKGLHALQLELAQSCYMDEAPPYAWDEALSQPVTAVLRKLVDALLEWKPPG